MIQDAMSIIIYILWVWAGFFIFFPGWSYSSYCRRCQPAMGSMRRSTEPNHGCRGKKPHNHKLIVTNCNCNPLNHQKTIIVFVVYKTQISNLHLWNCMEIPWNSESAAGDFSHCRPWWRELWLVGWFLEEKPKASVFFWYTNHSNEGSWKKETQ